MSNNPDFVKAELSVETTQAIHASLDSLDRDLAFARTYSNEEKHSFLKPGEEMIALGRSLPDVIERNQASLPAGVIDPAELRRDLALHDSLTVVISRTSALLQRLEDTKMALQHDIAGPLLELYGIADYLGDRVPDLRTRMQPMKQLFRKRRRPRPEASAPSQS